MMPKSMWVFIIAAFFSNSFFAKIFLTSYFFSLRNAGWESSLLLYTVADDKERETGDSGGAVFFVFP